MTSKTLPIKSTKQIQEYIAAVRKGMNSHFVMQQENGWLVRNHIDSSSKSFLEKDAAVSYATRIASKQRGTIFIFDSQGNLLEQ